MRTKRKTESHITERKSLRIIEDVLPDFWTIREYKPDYGLDLIIELFEEKDSEKYDTLGEHLFIQVKGTKNPKFGYLNVKKRDNIENFPLAESESHQKLEVIKYPIDTVELRTVQRMGSSIPVMLFVVDINTKKIYFVCLNDYIDKIILPEKPNYFKQETLTVNIPTQNCLNKNNLGPIYLYAKRPKFYAFFIKVGYQNNELNFASSNIVKQCQHFARILLFHDVFHEKNNWHSISTIEKELKNILEYGEGPSDKVKNKEFDSTEKVWCRYNEDEENLVSQHDMMNQISLEALWRQMDAMKNIYESICREWYLPTYLGTVITMHNKELS